MKKQRHHLLKTLVTMLLVVTMVLSTAVTAMAAPGGRWGRGWNWGSWGSSAAETAEEEEPAVESEPEAAVEEAAEEPAAEEEAAAEEAEAEEPAAEEEAEEPAAEEEVIEAEEAEEPAAEEEAEEEAPVYAASPISAESENYAAVISFGEDAKIPEGTTAVITEFAEGSDEYEAAKEKVMEEKSEEEVSGFAAFDITLYNGDAIVEPDAAVNVAIELKGLPEEAIEAADTLEINHLDESTSETVVETVATAEEIAVEGDTVSAEFEVEGFSTYTISWGTRSYKIHYVDTNGNSLTPTRTPEFSNEYKYLIYDVDGYEYDSTHYGSRTGTAIKPLLANYYNDRIYLTNNDDWDYLRNDIYVVYKKKTAPTSGGTPSTDSEEEWPEGNDAPQFSKSSVSNGNGTNTISLSIAAAEKPVEKSTPADVIVVFDVSGSMSNGMNGQTRLARAKTAVNTMAKTLLGTNSNVRMALISFSTAATTVQSFTNNYTTYSGKVTGLNADGGTNWEQALQLANQMQVRPDAATFVVFVTDGDPTFRVSRGDVSDANLDIWTDYYASDNVFGEGDDDSESRNFDFAVDQVSAIAGANKQFYSIGISTDVTKVKKLTTDGGVAADHAFLASDATAMDNAFKSITESIKSVLGFGDVEITDGITALTNAEMKVKETVDPDSFQYYRWGGEGNKYGADEVHKTKWTTREADGCAAASYNESTGAVEWNMGENFQLESTVHYVVTFRVWASQDAYNLVADLNNRIKTYDSLTDAEKAQVVEAGTDAEGKQLYALKTNTDQVKATYNKTTKTGDTVTVSDTVDATATYHAGTIDNLSLTSMKLTIKKEFEDDLTAAEDRKPEVTLVMKRRSGHQATASDEPFVDYKVPQNGTTSANIVLNEDNNWKYELYVAPGLEVDGEVLESGYDFTITEPGIDYHYGLIEEVINPMVVDGADMYYGDGYLLDDDVTVQKYVDHSLTAVNRVKSGIDVKKIVVDKDGNEIQPDVEFTIKGKILDADGNPYTWTEGDNINASGAYHKYDKDGNQIITKGHFASTDNIELKLKPGEWVRFINVPDGCYFEFTEAGTTMPEGYEWKKTEGIAQHRTAPNGPFTTEGDVQPVVENDGKVKLGTIENGKVKLGTGVVGDKQYVATFTNTSENGEWFYVYHSSDNTIEKIYAEDERVTKGEYNAETKTYEYTFNIVDEVKAEDKDDPKYLYGGYFKAYGGAGMSEDEIKAAKYVTNGTKSGGVYGDEYTGGSWISDENGTKYDGSKANFWKNANVLTENGLEMHPEANKIYYLKEIPNQYFRPAIYYVYDKYSGLNDLKNLYLMVPTDDSVYMRVSSGVDGLAPSTKLYMTYKVTASDGSSTSYKASTANANLKRGYLTVWDASSLIEAGKTYTMTPVLVTKDGVNVSSTVSRKIVMGNTYYDPSTSKMYTEDPGNIEAFHVIDTKIASTAE